jgi:RecA/RadA recombinase
MSGPPSVIRQIQKRWGTDAIQPMEAMLERSQTEVIPTGFAQLDHALPPGGVPRGRITELMCTPTSGMTTVALSIAARVQAMGEAVAYMDFNHTFDPGYAQASGLNLEHLYVLLPDKAALEMAYDLVVGGGIGLLIFDSLSGWMAANQNHDQVNNWLQRLNNQLLSSSSAIILLNSTTIPLAQQAAVRLHFMRKTWHFHARDVESYETQVKVQKNRFAPVAENLSLNIRIVE